MTREEWLERAVERLWPLFPEREGGGARPLIKVSVGWPKGRHGGRKVVGECWAVEASADKSTSHIFVSPELETPPVALPVLLHELVHVWAGTEAKHRGKFIAGAKAVGLQKPWTASVPTSGLVEHLEMIAGELGPYPHVGLYPLMKPKQKTRMRLYECSHGQKIRAATDELHATCLDCETEFKLRKKGEEEEE